MDAKPNYLVGTITHPPLQKPYVAGDQVDVSETKREACGHHRQTKELPCPYPGCPDGTTKNFLTVKVMSEDGSRVHQKLRLRRRRREMKDAHPMFVWQPMDRR